MTSRPLTRRQAQAHVDAVRAEMTAAGVETESNCELAAGLLAARLIDTADAHLRVGETGDGEHWWVLCQGYRLDPTADQFTDLWELPLVCRDRHKRSSYRLSRSIPITRASVTDHLSEDTTGRAAAYAALAQRCPRWRQPWVAQAIAATELSRAALTRLHPQPSVP